MKIEIIKLGTCYGARPAGRCGTVGWHPFPWTMACASTPEKAKKLFMETHKQVNKTKEKTNGNN